MVQNSNNDCVVTGMVQNSNSDSVVTGMVKESNVERTSITTGGLVANVSNNTSIIEQYTENSNDTNEGFKFAGRNIKDPSAMQHNSTVVMLTDSVNQLEKI